MLIKPAGSPEEYVRGRWDRQSRDRSRGRASNLSRSLFRGRFNSEWRNRDDFRSSPRLGLHQLLDARPTRPWRWPGPPAWRRDELGWEGAVSHAAATLLTNFTLANAMVTWDMELLFASYQGPCNYDLLTCTVCWICWSSTDWIYVKPTFYKFLQRRSVAYKLWVT